MYGNSRGYRGDRNNGSRNGGYNSRGNGGYRSGGGFGRGRKIRSFDPTNFVKQVDTEPEVFQEAYVVKHTFSDFDINESLKKNILERGYTIPTPIQDQAIPQILSGHDVVGLANTGTGKTGAFLIPLINKALKNPQEKILIIVPTRELAVQIDDELRLFAKNLRMNSVVCIGGVSTFPQKSRLRQRPTFVIGTPGRLCDLAEQRALYFEDYTSIVLDEVDRMLDMGFIHDVRAIAGALPETRQSLFFSATMSANVHQVMQSFLTDPVMISVKSKESRKNVVQDIVKVNGRNKVDVLHELLQQDGMDKVLVFARTKHQAERLAITMRQRRVNAGSIHGNKSQGQRQRAIDEFKSHRTQVLIATDVVSRGLDIDNVTHVINYDLPETQEDYIHRIGRTGRADQKGIALTLVE